MFETHIWLVEAFKMNVTNGFVILKIQFQMSKPKRRKSTIHINLPE